MNVGFHGVCENVEEDGKFCMELVFAGLVLNEEDGDMAEPIMSLFLSRGPVLIIGDNVRLL